MLAILPEIYKSGIWKKYAGKIEEYAGKFGDIADTTTRKRLRLEENLSDKPFLRAAIATVGVHKVAMVAKITTPEMDKSMAEKLCNMSKSAVQSLSKELRASQSSAGQNGDGAEGVSEMQLSFEDVGNIGQQSVLKNCNFSGQRVSASDFAHHHATNQSSSCHAIALTKKIELDENSTFLFLKLKQKLGKNLSDKEFLKLIIEEREKQEFTHGESKGRSKIVLQNSREYKQPADETLHEKSNQTKVTSAESLTGETSNESSNESSNSNKIVSVESVTSKISSKKSISGETQSAKSLADSGTKQFTSTKLTASRYIPAAKRRQAIATTNGRCSYPNCNSHYAVLHHIDRYSESKNHDSVIPLCKVHHEFAHNNLIKNEVGFAGEWKLAVRQETTTKISQADFLYRKYRKESISSAEHVARKL